MRQLAHILKAFRIGSLLSISRCLNEMRPEALLAKNPDVNHLQLARGCHFCFC